MDPKRMVDGSVNWWESRRNDFFFVNGTRMEPRTMAHLTRGGDVKILSYRMKNLYWRIVWLKVE